ncbi:hypothetical protein RHMOL_Rhmol01G0207200 [Rhododendron molle]|uniref:Uncharacterized protein n=1 Tax=Rhododendron molle TaxID=49168 RepID=A0ACC0Q5Q3_RHOML|nr:hypothetical protein RHMOL_Rhmol01G0207200 [Rhododendron molle]
MIIIFVLAGYIMDDSSIDPGPTDGSLLVFRNSTVLVLYGKAIISYNVIQGNPKVENVTLICRRNDNNLRQLGRPSPRIVELIYQAGFGGILEMPFITLDHAFITALVERWRPEIHTFHLRSGESTVTLQDVEIITGLAVNGRPVTRDTRFDQDKKKELCERLLGLNPPGEVMSGFKVSLKWLRDNFNGKVEEEDDEVTALTRVGCPAVFSVTLEGSSGKYLVNNFVSVHNHPMIGPCGVPFLRSHRKVRSSDKASANTMHKVGIKTSHIMDFMVQQSGGYEFVGYTQKDLYNYFTAQRNIEVADGDAEGALAYLCAKAENDPLFYYKYDVDEQNRLNNLFWRDVTCRTDYMCFGDVLIFDSTYRTNAYRKPLVILAGVNSHFQTAIFGCALLTVETVEAYTWVLERFLDSMDHKKLVSVMTDGDKAMRRAIKTVFPDVNHRLCIWHLKKNAVSNVHVP